MGDPVPAFVTLFGVELLMIAAVTVAGDAVGFVSRNNAATPATCGEAIDVPEIVLVAVSLVRQAEVIPLPGAKMSTQVPKFENEERVARRSRTDSDRARGASRRNVTRVLAFVSGCHYKGDSVVDGVIDRGIQRTRCAATQTHVGDGWLARLMVRRNEIHTGDDA